MKDSDQHDQHLHIHQHDHDCNHDHDHDHDCRHDHDHDAADETVRSKLETYHRNGVRFRYPSNWEVSDETGQIETTITVQSPGTTYMTVSLFADRPEPERVIATVLEAYEDIYEDIEVSEPSKPKSAAVIRREIDFVCLDLISTVTLTAFQTDLNTVLVVTQGHDLELKTTQAVLDSMLKSLSCD